MTTRLHRGDLPDTSRYKGAVAIDTETMGLDLQRDRLCVVQLSPGDGSADQVKIQAILSEGLENARGNKIDFDIGNLAAGESRNVTLLCATRGGGAQKCEATAVAEGGLSAKDA